MRLRTILITAGGCLAVAAAALLFGEPALADAQISSDNRALAQAARHQATIDAALQQFLTRSAGAASDDNLLNQSSQDLAQYESARNLVTGDLSALQAALEPSWLVALAWGRAGALDGARQRTNTALGALTQAGAVLSAAVDQERLQQSFFYASVTETKMLTAIDNQQYVDVDAYYIQADRALRVAESLTGKSDVPPGYKPAVVAMRTIVDQTKRYAAALLRNDQAAADPLHNAMRAGYASLSAATGDAAINANDDWNDRMYQPMIAAYHTGLAAILS